MSHGGGHNDQGPSSPEPGRVPQSQVHRSQPVHSSQKRRQLSLATVMMLVTAFAVTFAWYRSHRQLAIELRSLQAMRSLARELVVDDPTQIALVKRMPTSSKELIFDLYIPPPTPESSNHRLCLALEGITGLRKMATSFPPPDQCQPMTPGRHKIEIAISKADSTDPQSTHEVTVLIDDFPVMTATRPLAWHDSGGWSSSGEIETTETYPSSEKVEIIRRRFNRKVGNGSVSVRREEPVNGVLLWIEPIL